MKAFLNIFVSKEYFEQVSSLIKNTPFSLWRIITEEQYVAFGSQYTFKKDFTIGMGPFKKSLLKAYFLTPKGHRTIMLELEIASKRIDKRNIAKMIEDYK